MCRIAYCKTRKLDEDEFKDGWQHNNDGVGFGWTKNEEIHSIKGLMKLKEAWGMYKEVNPPIPHVVHFRKGTSGTCSRELTHPFIISKNSEHFLNYNGKIPLLFHNGVISDWRKLFVFYTMITGNIIKNELSDTRLLAIIMAKIEENDYKSFLEIAEPTDKFAIITAKGITLSGKYTENEDGIFYSDFYFSNLSKNYWDNISSPHNEGKIKNKKPYGIIKTFFKQGTQLPLLEG